MRLGNGHIPLGDRVRVDLSPNDLTRGYMNGRSR
jgi:translation initiation factor IF-1